MDCCMKHLPKKPVIVTRKIPCKCQGLCLMREFSKKNEVKCKTLEIPESICKTKDFVTGSYYEGEWNRGWGMHGHGVYTFPNDNNTLICGVVYKGEFKEGVMHGKGELRYQTVVGPATIRGEWKDGIMTERTILFDNNMLEYEENDWQYCKMPDRRYSKEYGEGLQPGGRSYQTAYQPSKDVPEGTNDTDDGFYDQMSHLIYDHDDETKILSAKNKCVCQGLCLLKAFTKKHKEKECKPWEVPGPSYKAKEFLTGSSYEGDWRDGCGMHGYGEYTFPNGVVYEGEFEYGAMHGKGELRYQTRAGEVIIRGRWKNDIMIERTLIVNGSLEYKEKDWKYCKIPDRRYSAEYGVGLQPAGNSFLTSYKPVRQIPEGYYDVGYGVYDPAMKLVYSYDLSKCIKSPGDKEQQWILQNCRLGKATPLGPRQDLYDTYIQPTTEPAPVPPPQSLTKTTKFTKPKP